MKKGFTLAEILVTIGVLGVLAAITIPTLVRSTIGNSMINKARVTQNQLAKVLQTSYGSKYGTAEFYPSFTSQEFYDDLKMFLPVKEMSEYGSRVDLPIPYWETIYGEKLYAGAVVELENDVILSFVTHQYNDAMLTGRLVQIIMDVNGREEPNTDGKDIFRMIFNAAPDYKVFPYGKLVGVGYNIKDDEELRKYCYTGKSRTKFSKSSWYVTMTASYTTGENPRYSKNLGVACLEYLNRTNWNLSKYPVKDFAGDGE